MSKRKTLKKTKKSLNLFDIGGQLGGTNTALNADIEKSVYGESSQDPLMRLANDLSGKSTKEVLNTLNDRPITKQASSNEELLNNWNSLDFKNTLDTNKNEWHSILSAPFGFSLDKDGKAYWDFDNISAFGQGANQGNAATQGNPWGMLIGGIIGGVANFGSQLGRNSRIKKINEAIENRNEYLANNFNNQMSNINTNETLNLLANQAAYGGRFNRFDDGSFMPKLDTSSLEDVINTESSFNRDEKIKLPYESKYIGLIHPFTGGYANLNTQEYENLKEGNGEYRTPIHISRNIKNEENLKEVDKGHKFIHDWYSNSKRQAIKAQNDLETLLIQRDAYLNRKNFYDSKVSSSIEDGNKKDIKYYKKKRNKDEKRIDSLNKEIIKFISNPEGIAEKTSKELKNSIQEVINLPISIYDSNSGKNTLYYNSNEVFPDFNYIESTDKNKYTPRIIEETLDDGRKVRYRQTTRAYYSPNSNKRKRFLSFDKNKAFNPEETSSVGEEDQHAMELESSELLARNIVNGIKKYDPDFTFDDYYDSGKEILGKLGNLRKELNIDPNKEYSLKEIKEMKKNYTGDNHIMKNYPPEIITPLFNRLKDGGPLFNEFTNGINIINEGGTHENNPYEGVQVGVDPEGIPNLVEEGEVIWNDYVFSDRLKVPNAVRHKYKLRGNKNTTFADSAKEIQKMSEEMPNDPIVKRTMESKMADLMMEQEAVRIKKESRKKYRKYATGGILGNLFNGEGDQTNTLKKYSNYTKVGNEFYTPEYMRLYNWFKSNHDTEQGQALINRINNEEFGNVGGNTFNADDIIRLGVDNKKGPVHDAISKVALEEGDWEIPESIFDSEGNVIKWAYDPQYNVEDNTQTDKIIRDPNKVRSVINQSDSDIDAPVKSDASNTGSGKGNSSEGKWGKIGTSLMQAAPVFGSLAAVINDVAGGNKPYYDNVQKYEDAINSAYQPITANVIGDYLTYNPYDTQYALNNLASSQAASRNAIMNASAGNSAAARASILASDYNYGNQIGGIYRTAREYNDAHREKVSTFNRGTNQYNATALDNAARFNAQLAASKADAIGRAAQWRDNIYQANRAEKSANLTGLLEGISGLGQTLYNQNNLEMLQKNGIYTTSDGKMIQVAQNNPSKVTSDMVKNMTDEELQAVGLTRVVAHGGKIKRRKRRLS